jgi:hypothetical protein
LTTALLIGGCTAPVEDSSAIYTREMASGVPQLPAGASVEVTLTAASDAADLLASRPELSSAIAAYLPGYVGTPLYAGSHLALVVEVLGARETEDGAELYVDGSVCWWSLASGELEFPSGGELIGRMRFERSENELQFVAWDQPLDGELLVPGIRALFPAPYADRAIQRLGNRQEQWRLSEELGRRWADQQSDE